MLLILVEKIVLFSGLKGRRSSWNHYLLKRFTKTNYKCNKGEKPKSSRKKQVWHQRLHHPFKKVRMRLLIKVRFLRLILSGKIKEKPKERGKKVANPSAWRRKGNPKVCANLRGKKKKKEKKG